MLLEDVMEEANLLRLRYLTIRILAVHGKRYGYSCMSGFAFLICILTSHLTAR